MALQSFTLTVGAVKDSDNNDKNYVSGQAIYIKKTNGTLASIYRDLAGTSQITQDGFSNVTSSKGQFTFFVDAGDYIAEYGTQSTPITVVGPDYFNNRIDETVNQIILDLSTSRGFRVVGDFASGFTYELPNDVGIDGSGNYWIYTDINALPFIVPAATTPSTPTYTQVTFNDALAVSYTENGNVDAALRKRPATYTLAEAQAADLDVGQNIFISDRSCDATVVSGETPDSFFIIDLNGTKQLKINPLLSTAVPEVTPRMAGADVNNSDNSAAIKAAYDFAHQNGFKFVFDKLYPTTQTVDFSSFAAQIDGVGRGAWRDADPVNSVVGGILYSGSGDAVTCSNGSQRWRNFKIRCNGASASCIHFNGNAATLMDLEHLRLQNTGNGDGILITGNNGGESLRVCRVEASKHNAALRVNRTDTQLNNMQLDKVNFHRNNYGCKFDSGVQRILINNGGDFTLNTIAGVAFYNNVDTDSKIENNWFENNGTDILLDCDQPYRGVTTENNKLAEASNQAVYCKNGYIISNNDKVNSTPIGFRFDVSTSRSVVALGSSTGVTTMFSGDTSNLAIKPRQNIALTEHRFSVKNIAASSSGRFDIVGLLSGSYAVRLNRKSVFFSVDVQVHGATPTTGKMDVRISKNTNSNVNNFFKPTIDNSIINNRIYQVSPLGNNQFSSSADFDNFFLTYTTDAAWDAITSEIFVIVKTLDVGL